MFVAALLLEHFASVFAPGQLMEENEPLRVRQGGCGALTSALLISDNPQPTRTHLCIAWSSEAIRSRPRPPNRRTRGEVRTRLDVPHVCRSSQLPESARRFRNLKGRGLATSYFRRTSRPISTRMIGFSPSCRRSVLMLLTGTIAYFTTDSVIEALRNLGEG